MIWARYLSFLRLSFPNHGMETILSQSYRVFERIRDNICNASSIVFGNNRSSENGNNYHESSGDGSNSFMNVHLILLKFYFNLLFGFSTL